MTYFQLIPKPHEIAVCCQVSFVVPTAIVVFRLVGTATELTTAATIQTNLSTSAAIRIALVSAISSRARPANVSFSTGCVTAILIATTAPMKQTV